jgi:hypothetical protein
MNCGVTGVEKYLSHLFPVEYAAAKKFIWYAPEDGAVSGYVRNITPKLTFIVVQDAGRQCGAQRETETKTKRDANGMRVHLSSPFLTFPHLSSPFLTFPHHTSPYLTFPHHTSPFLTFPHLSSPFLTIPHHTSPYLTFPHHTVCTLV